MATAIAEADLKKSGASKETIEFYTAAYKFLKAGGTFNTAMTIVVAAADKLSGQLRFEAHKSHAGHADGKHHYVQENHKPVAQPVREPSAEQRNAAARVAKMIAVTVLDSYRVRDGRSIGDVRYGELERLRAANAAEAAVVRQIQKHVTADHDAKIRDIIKPRDLERMIQKAAEIADAS